MRLCSDRDFYNTSSKNPTPLGWYSTINRDTVLGPKRLDLKVRFGRGRKIANWVDALHLELCEEIERLGKVGVKINFLMLRQLATTLLRELTSPH